MSAKLIIDEQQLWTSQRSFLMASIGFAVGLGNIWRFPYIVGENGGAAFLIVYLLAAFCIGVPLLIAEMMIGRRGGGSPLHALIAVARESAAPRAWGAVGLAAIATVFVILTFYAVVAGWTIDYLVRAASNQFSGLSADGASELFDGLLADPARMAFWQAVVLLLTVFIVMRGVRNGIETAVNVLMPALFACLVLMVIYSAFIGDLSAGLKFLLEPDFTKMTVTTILIAVGQAFFSIGIAMAGMMAYGAYLPKHVSIPKSAVTIVAMDATVALMAGLAIFPIIFANGLEPSDGPGLIFKSLPLAFGSMYGGQFFGTCFFLLVVTAAITSCIGSLEPHVSWAEEYWNSGRKKCSIILGLLIWVLGLGTVFSFNRWSSFYPLVSIPVLSGKTIFEVQNFLASNVLLLLGAASMSVFAGWVVPEKSAMEELHCSGGLLFNCWRFITRYVAPVFLLIILFMSVL